nr:hypothetical protein [Tanacetum cinerariifolium]
MLKKKFNLEANYPLNLSAKLTSIDDNLDIIDDHEKYMSFKPDIPETPLYKSKPMISKHYKKETDVKVGKNFNNKEALDLAIRLKALDEGYQFLNDRTKNKGTITRIPTDEKEVFEMLFISIDSYVRELSTTIAYNRCGTLKGSIQGNKSDSCRHGWKQPNYTNCFWYMQRGNRHAAIALAVHNEFPLAYHAVCCCHLIMNLSLKRDKIKDLFWKICKAYPIEEFSSSISHLQDIQPDVYDKLCQVGPQRWSRAHCPLVCYNYLTSNSVESVNACTVVYRKLPVLKLAETYHAMVQEWELEAEATLANTMFGNLTRYFEQIRIREIQITMLQNMPTMSLNSYGLHALLMTHEADMRTTNNLIRARKELLRSIAEKQNFINNYRAI